MGCSTGVYCILKAAYDNPNSNILISGISLEGGPYFQGSRNMTEGRAEVDKYSSLSNERFDFPRAFLKGTHDFSFSGMKTAFLNLSKVSVRVSCTV